MSDQIFIVLINAFKNGSKIIKGILVLGSLCILASGTIFALADAKVIRPLSDNDTLGLVSLLIAGIGILIFASSNEIARVAKEKKQKLDEVEQRAKEHPEQAKAAWDLARIKLESYLDRNLSQVRSIYGLTVIVMLVGFGLIATGVYLAITQPQEIAPSLIAAVSGILVNFIGATFLVLYKSTMNQAKEYVSILERINAVGMSVQILDSLEESEDRLKQKTTAELSKELLHLYKLSNSKK